MFLLQIAETAISDAVTQDTTQELIKTLQKFSARLVIDLISITLLIRLVYFKAYKRSDLFFTFYIFNIIIFLICFLLNKVELSMGAAFGLFAVFSMLRYRTEDISLKDMTYLFLVIAIGLISAVTKIKDTQDSYEYIFLGLINFVIIGAAFLFETNVLFKKELVHIINYEKIELIKAQNKDALMADLKERTGLNIHRFSISKIDFLKDSAQIKIYYFEN